MTSDRKVETNRLNALSSTGPRTRAGKRRASRNAVRHGLAAATANGRSSPEIEELASKLAGNDPDPTRLNLARLSAEAHLDVVHVRHARMMLIALELSRVGDGPDREVLALLNVLPQLLKLERYERRAFSHRKRAFRRLFAASAF